MKTIVGTLCLQWAVFGATLSNSGFAQDSAADWMQRSHDGRAVWQNFPGFQAQVRVTRDAQSSSGTLAVAADGTVTLKLSDAANAEWSDRTLRSVISHRLADSDSICEVEFADNDDRHPLGRLIRSRSASEKSLWRVQGDVLTEVHRFGKDSRFIISVTEVSRTAEGKHLPRSYTVTTWSQPSGALVSTRQIFNQWTRIGHFDLPSRLLAITSRADGSRQVDDIVLTDHRLGPSTPSTTSARAAGNIQ